MGDFITDVSYALGYPYETRNETSSSRHKGGTLSTMRNAGKCKSYPLLLTIVSNRS